MGHGGDPHGRCIPLLRKLYSLSNKVKDSPHDQHGFAFLDDRYVIWPVVCAATEDDWEAYRIGLFDCLDPKPLGITGSAEQLAELRGKYYTLALDLPQPTGGDSHFYGGTRDISICMRDGHLFPTTQDQPFVRSTDDDVLAVSFVTVSEGYHDLKQHTLVLPKSGILALAKSPRHAPEHCERGMRHQSHLAWEQWGRDARIFTTPMNRLDAAEICRSRLHITECPIPTPGIEDHHRLTRVIYDFNPRPLRRDPRGMHTNPETCCEGRTWSDEPWAYRPDEIEGVLQTLPFRRTLLPPAITDSLPEYARGPPVIVGEYFVAIQRRCVLPFYVMRQSADKMDCSDDKNLVYRVWSV